MANDGSSHVQDGVVDAASRRELMFARCALAAIVLAAVLARAGGLNPSTLWFDDVWVAALAKLPSAWAALSAPAPAPPGFVLLLWGVDKIGLDPEWGLQFVPFLVALATIPLVGHLVRRLTGSPWTGLLAAALMAMSPWLAYHSSGRHAVIVMPAAQWSLAYYGPWAYSVKREPQSSTSFVIALSDDGPLMLPFAGAQEIAKKLDRLIEDRQRTIHLVESLIGILPEEVNLPALVESRGYREHYERRDVQIQVTTYRFRPSQRSLATAGR